MENIFKNLGYQFCTDDGLYEGKITFLYIGNHDGTPRWIWNEKNPNPDFLKFYNITGFKPSLFSFLVKILFLLKIQKWVFKKKQFFYKKQNDSFFTIEKNWALFTGTVGPNNKTVIYTKGVFYKIPTTNNAVRMIENEAKILNEIKNGSHFKIPSAQLLDSHCLQLADISQKGKRAQCFSENHSLALFDLYAIHSGSIRISFWTLFQTLKQDFYTINDQRIPKNMLRKIDWVLQDLEEDKEIELAFSHGDFTSWNSFISENKLAIYDWELASYDKPKAFDFFHFIIQNGILIEKKSWKKIYQDIKEANTLCFKLSEKELHEYLKYYLLVNTLQYLKIYAAQENWHEQIYWLFSTWSDAFNLFLKDKYKERPLLIMDFFDEIHQENYATLKFPDDLPENLSLYSDIDLVSTKGVTKKIIQFFKNHSLVDELILNKKSFLKNCTIFTNNREILSIDCIEQLKWKNIEILKAREILEEKTKSNFGIKTTSKEDLKRFLMLFYTLNNAEIPEKYQSIINQVHLSKNGLDEILQTLTIKNTTSIYKKKIISILQRQPSNQGFNFIKNTFNYILDLFSSKGFIITFSGVDGAGKTTTISKFSQMMESNYRKPVIGLRHRPSVLPILSVWSKGKEKAQQEVLSSLPRQGKNTHFLSSFLRFSYYYADYVLGQFYIYFKYVLRGYIVVYDRYYFDFMVDGKRSNIVLPKIVPKIGYFFLLKPKYNFFLYAEPELILKRKKELSYEVIKTLTSEYKNLFESLHKKNSKTVYKSINNIDLTTTLDDLNRTLLLKT